jgi:hypothetical protein
MQRPTGLGLPGLELEAISGSPQHEVASIKELPKIRGLFAKRRAPHTSVSLLETGTKTGAGSRVGDFDEQHEFFAADSIIRSAFHASGLAGATGDFQLGAGIMIRKREEERNGRVDSHFLPRRGCVEPGEEKQRAHWTMPGCGTTAALPLSVTRNPSFVVLFEPEAFSHDNG